MTADTTISNLKRVSYTLSFLGLAVGLVVLPFNPRAALLPAAVVFGWSQIGGL